MEEEKENHISESAESAEGAAEDEPDGELSPGTESRRTLCKPNYRRWPRVLLTLVAALLITFGLSRMCLTLPNTNQCLNTTAYVWSRLLIGQL